MSSHDEIDRQRLYVNPEIKNLKNVKTVSDYLKAVSRDQRWKAKGTGSPRRPNVFRRRRPWSRADKLNLAILITGVLALAATVLALMITAGVRIL
jgi:hypothetical protein